MQQSHNKVKNERDLLRNRIINLESRVNQSGVHSESDPKAESQAQNEESKETKESKAAKRKKRKQAKQKVQPQGNINSG